MWAILGRMSVRRVNIAGRYCGPPRSGNGGYTAGLLGELMEGPCEVTLRAPPPLELPMTMERDAAGVGLLRREDTLIAEAVAAAFETALPEPVSFAEAERASRGYIGFHAHPYPTCFVCGPQRARGDGLTIFPGAVEGRQLVAAPWVPGADLCDAQDQVQARYIWASLDCPSWFGFAAFSPSPPVLLGRLASVIVRRPHFGERCVALGWHTGSEGRRIGCASALFADDGRCLAYSRSTWVALKTDPAQESP